MALGLEKIPQRSVKVSSMRMIRSAMPMAWNLGFISDQCHGLCSKRPQVGHLRSGATQHQILWGCQCSTGICHGSHLICYHTGLMVSWTSWRIRFFNSVIHWHLHSTSFLWTDWPFKSTSSVDFCRIERYKEYPKEIRQVMLHQLQSWWLGPSVGATTNHGCSNDSWQLVRQRAMQKLRQSPHLEGNLKLSKSRCSFWVMVFNVFHFFLYWCFCVSVCILSFLGLYCVYFKDVFWRGWDWGGIICITHV